MRLSGVLAGLMLVVAAPRAAAETKLELGARTGYALPFGGVSNDGARGLAMSDFTVGQVPLWLDIGARVGRRAFFGAYLSYGVALLSDELASYCDLVESDASSGGGTLTCNVHDLRLGAQVQYHFGPFGPSLDPWFGVGFGYEWLSAGLYARRNGEQADLAATFHGFEFAHLQAGLDVSVADTMTVGPFIAFTLGSYDRSSRSCVGDRCFDRESSERVADTALHHWLFLGLRAEFVP